MRFVILFIFVFAEGYSYAPKMPDKMRRELSSMVKEECDESPTLKRCERIKKFDEIF